MRAREANRGFLFREPGRFAGWPANNRIWSWGDEILVAFDDGMTWSDEIILRDDGRNWDLGYCRMIQRPDGKLVTIYYFTTRANPEQHIAATIWDPNRVS